MRILFLCTDAFGGHGGIAKFNRDLLSALCSSAEVDAVVALPRLMPESPGELPQKLRYDTSGVGGKLNFLRAVVRVARDAAGTSTLNPRPSTAGDLILCGHINLLPAAFLARKLFRRPQRSALNSSPSTPIVLVIHGIDAWQPPRSWLVRGLVQHIDAFISVSEFTKQRFLVWAKVKSARSFILPNCVDFERFKPGQKNDAVLERYGLDGRTVLLTLTRLSETERYKGVDEVLEVLPELAKQIPNLSYLIVGDGSDRERLIEKARSLGLSVSVFPCDNGNRTADPLHFERGEGKGAMSNLRTSTSQLSTINSQLPKVIFAGYIPETEKVDHYRLADVFVMPGCGEGFGIVYLEALACGIPVVASKADASREVVQNGRWGIVVDPKNRGEIREGIIRALSTSSRVSANDVAKYSFVRYCERGQEILRSLTEPELLGRAPAARARTCPDLK